MLGAPTLACTLAEDSLVIQQPSSLSLSPIAVLPTFEVGLPALLISCSFLLAFLWLSFRFLVASLWISHGSILDFLCLSYGFPVDLFSFPVAFPKAFIARPRLPWCDPSGLLGLNSLPPWYSFCRWQLCLL